MNKFLFLTLFIIIVTSCSKSKNQSVNFIDSIEAVNKAFLIDNKWLLKAYYNGDTKEWLSLSKKDMDTLFFDFKENNMLEIKNNMQTYSAYWNINAASFDDINFVVSISLGITDTISNVYIPKSGYTFFIIDNKNKIRCSSYQNKYTKNVYNFILEKAN